MQGAGHEPEHGRRDGDEHTKEIVRLTIQEIFDGVGVDFSTSLGRQRFRDKITFLDDAMTGTKALKRVFWGGVSTLGALVFYKIWPALLLWLSK